MSELLPVLVDSGIIVAYYDNSDPWFAKTRKFFDDSRAQFVITEPCATEVMWLLQANQLTQNEFLSDLAKGLYKCEPLKAADFARIAELNAKYSDFEADYPDLSLIAISERLDIPRVASLDQDFSIYRRYGKKRFERVFP